MQAQPLSLCIGQDRDGGLCFNVMVGYLYVIEEGTLTDYRTAAYYQLAS